MILFVLFWYHLLIFYVSLSAISLNRCVSFFNKNLIKSIEVLYGNKTFDQSSIKLISSLPPSFDLYFEINYIFNYKISFDLGYSLYLFMKS